MSTRLRRVTPLLFLLLAGPVRAAEIPTGTSIEVRLKTALASYSSKKNDPIDAVLLSPIQSDGEVVVPAGAELHGRVTKVNKVGLGFVHETAALEVDFHEVTLSGGHTPCLRVLLADVDNAREFVTKSGRVKGIRATGSLGYRLTGYLNSLAAWKPIVSVPVLAFQLLFLRFPEPEIYYPAGVDLHLKLMAPLRVDELPEPRRPRMTFTAAERVELARLVNAQPFRTYTEGSPKPSDVTNLMFVGEQAQIGRAFDAAGWAEAHELSGKSKFNTFLAVAANRRYREAPMSVLTLDGQAPDETWQKGLNTFAKRHHLRSWKRPADWHGTSIWASSSTEDTGIAFSKHHKAFIHLIDENIDDERSKVVNDLVYTGCVDAVNLVERPDVPRDAMNSTGDRLLTDGRMAVIFLNACEDPRESTEATEAAPPRARGNLLYRFGRRIVLSTRNDLLRSNIFWFSYSTISTAVKFLRHKNEKPVLPPRRAIDVNHEIFVEEDSEEDEKREELEHERDEEEHEQHEREKAQHEQERERHKHDQPAHEPDKPVKPKPPGVDLSWLPLTPAETPPERSRR